MGASARAPRGWAVTRLGRHIAPPASGVETEMPFISARAAGVMPSPRAIRYSVSPATTRCVPGAGAERNAGAAGTGGCSSTRSGSACAGASTTRGPSGVIRRGAGRSSVRSEVRCPGRSPLAGVPQPAASSASTHTRASTPVARRQAATTATVRVGDRGTREHASSRQVYPGTRGTSDFRRPLALEAIHRPPHQLLHALQVGQIEQHRRHRD